MNDPVWNRPVARSVERREPSSSVGSLPAPLPDGLSRSLAGRWREAILAERALGWVLWGALVVVMLLVSR